MTAQDTSVLDAEAFAAGGLTASEPATVSSRVSRYAVTFRRSTGAEQRLVDATEEDLRARYAELWPAGWRLWHLRGHGGESAARYTALWRQSLRSEIAVFGVPLEELTERYERLWEHGWRLKDVNGHPVLSDAGAVTRYTAVWEPSSAPERQVYGVSLAAFASRHGHLASQGWRLKALSVTTDPQDQQPRYTALWQPSVAPEVVTHEMSQVVYQARYERLWTQGWRLQLLAPYVEQGRPRYAAVWTRSPSAEIQMPAATLTDLEARYQTVEAQGWGLRFIEPF